MKAIIRRQNIWKNYNPYMKLNQEEWLSALHDIPNYIVHDFSVGRINVVGPYEVGTPVNAVKISSVHSETGLEVEMTLRLPDHMVPFLTESLAALTRALNRHYDEDQ